MDQQTNNPVVAEEAPSLHEQPSLQMVSVREGVVLRPMENSDAPAMMAAIHTDPSIRNRVGVAIGMATEDDVKAEVTRYKADPTVIRYALVDGNECVGLVSFWRDDEGYPGHETPLPYTYGFGYFLHPKARGKHLVSDSLRALMRVAERSFRTDSFIAFCADDNPQSSAVLMAAGLHRTDVSFTDSDSGWQERLYEKKVSHGQD